jgi:hypothetical protein
MPPITRSKERYQQQKRSLEQAIQRAEADVARKKKKAEKLQLAWCQAGWRGSREPIKKGYQVVAKAKRAALSLKFKLLCWRIQDNDPSVVSLNDESEFVDGYDEALGVALQGNTCISSISIYCYMLHAYCQISPQYIHFVNTSKFLTSVSLNGHHLHSRPRKELVDPVLCAIASNPSIKDVTLDLSLDPETLATFVRNAKSVRRLTIDFVFAHWKDIYQCSETVLAEAFSGAEALQSLTFLLFTDKLLPVLEGLLERCSSLQEFKLIMRNGGETGSQSWETACRLIHSSKSLQHLELGNVAFKTEWMEKLVHPFMDHDGSAGSPCPLLSKLVLRECCYKPGACSALVSLMQTKGSPMALRQLVLDGDSGYNSLRRGSDEADIGQFVYPMISAMSLNIAPTWIPTIGSQVQALTIHHYCRGFSGLLDKMGQCAHGINLQRLELYGMDYDNFEELSRNLPRLTFVKSLGLGAYCHEKTKVANLVLHMLRENDHVCYLSMLEEMPKPDSGDPDPRFMDAARFQLAQAYCQRNVHLVELCQYSPDYLHPSLLQATMPVSRQHFLLYQGLMN